ncbi:MAG: LacI family DNA-binding transcriptional regulator [Enterobacteriaceae bacterium]
MATIKDVARLAGVSIATVSRVINQNTYVQPVTRERVEAAMRRLNYRRNAAAAALATRSGNMLGLLTGNLSDPFFSRLAEGVEAVSRAVGFRLMVCSGSHQAEQERSGLNFLINQGCEAIVAHTTRLSSDELLRYAAHLPAMVLINRYLPALAHRCIWLDNIGAAKAATHYLIQQGHRHIACVTADVQIDDRRDRLLGYQQALHEAALPARQEWVISVPFNEEGGERAAEQLLAIRQPVSAVVTFNDVMAAGLIHVLHQQGVEMPRQLSVVGFDDVTLARYLYPALTTMHYPIEAMAHRAARLALQLYQQEELKPQQNGFQAHLVARNSVIHIDNWRAM